MSLSALVNKLRDNAEELFHLGRAEASAAQHSTATLVEAELRSVKAKVLGDLSVTREAVQKLASSSTPEEKAAALKVAEAGLDLLVKDLA